MVTKIQYAQVALSQRSNGMYAVLIAQGDSFTNPTAAQRLMGDKSLNGNCLNALAWVAEFGWKIEASSTHWFLRNGRMTRRLERRVEDVSSDNLCPNGQPQPECTEIDPCESCWQDDQEEGDMIEESMGLR